MELRWVLIWITVAALVSPASAAAVVVSVNGQTVGAGSKAVIPVTVSRASDLGGVDLTVTYDPNVLKYAGAEAGGISTNGMIESNEPVAGTVMIGIVDSKGMNGDGTLVDMTFSVIGASGTTSPVDVRVRGAYSTGQKEVAAQPSGGVITVGASGGASPISPVVAIGAVAFAGLAAVFFRRSSS